MAFQTFLLISGLVLIRITISTANTSSGNTGNNFTGNTGNNSTAKFIGNTENDTVVNLQVEVVPLHYNVNIRFYFKDNILFGECSILINISVALRSIQMYSAPITIIDAVLVDAKNETVYSMSSTYFKENNILILDFTKQLLHAVYPNVFILIITYMRIINNSNSTDFSTYQYLKELGQKLFKTDVVTMKARQLFPCRDELVTKSTFKIAIKHHEKYTVLSNMAIQKRYEVDYTMVWTDFEPFLISAQHVVVVITTFTNNDYQSLNNTNVTIWCRESIFEHIVEAKIIIETIVPYFKQEYLMELSKLDIVFQNSSDDNVATLGLLLLKETDIIYNEESDPPIRKREIAHIIARQLAFLWCEDVLLWSKEGFATFLGEYILNETLKDSSMMNLMVIQALQESFRYDDIIIDSEGTSLAPTSYLKSFIIWRMIYHRFSDKFWIGIRKHIEKQHKYSNMTKSDDLWTTILSIFIHQNTSLRLENLTRIIHSWTTNSYYSVINVTTINSFFMITYNQPPKPTYYINNIDWTPIPVVPLTYTTQSSLNYSNINNFIWVYITYGIPNIDNRNWIIANIQQAGYYRVNYDDENWNKLIHYLNSENYYKIHILNRAQFIDDAFYFFLQKQLSQNTFWNLTRFLLQDTNFLTWYPMIKIIEYITCLYPLEYSKEITEKIKSIIDQLVTKIGYFLTSNDDPLTVTLKEEAAKWACILGVPECLRVAAQELQTELQNPLTNNYLTRKKWIYCYGLKTAPKAIWLLMWLKFNATNDDIYLEYLPCIEDSVIIREYLSLILEDIQFQRNKRAVEFLFTIAKHANKDEVLSYIFNIKEIRHNSNSIHDVIATLIVVITHIHSMNHITMINNFVTNYEKRIVRAVKKKIKKRKFEYGRQIQKYGHYFG